MAKTRKIPLRKSVVSNQVIDKRDLLRIVKNKEGQVFIDPTGKALISNWITKKRFKLKRNKSLIAVLIWKWTKLSMMN